MSLDNGNGRRACGDMPALQNDHGRQLAGPFGFAQGKLRHARPTGGGDPGKTVTPPERCCQKLQRCSAAAVDNESAVE